MIHSVKSFILDGILARPVRVEVDVQRGLPGFAVLGLPDAAARESRERVRAALISCGFEFPLRRIVVNLVPASLRKAGPGLDLAIATALLCATEQLPGEGLADLALAGALRLDGATRPIPGALAIAEAAREGGLGAVVLPADNGPEAALATGIEVLLLAGLATLPALAAGHWRPDPPRPLALRREPPAGGPDLAELRGQPHLRHALEVAAAGGHSLLMIGPPGAGKSLAASRLSSILPPLSREEALEVARVASACGRLGVGPGGRPFRVPHYSISAAGLLGGGSPQRLGEITIGHRGVLFLDELGEFSRDALEALRGPLETGEVPLVGAGGTRTLPCRFQLLAAANPCPCGRGEGDPDCVCAPAAVTRYRDRLSGALADRIEILAAVRRPSAAEIGGPPGESSATVRERVLAAWERQARRLGSGRTNAEMTPAEARKSPLSAEASALLAELYARRRLGGRAHERVLRLAQTIADLAEQETIGTEELAQALALRRRDRD